MDSPRILPSITGLLSKRVILKFREGFEFEFCAKTTETNSKFIARSIFLKRLFL